MLIIKMQLLKKRILTYTPLLAQLQKKDKLNSTVERKVVGHGAMTKIPLPKTLKKLKDIGVILIMELIAVQIVNAQLPKNAHHSV